MLDTWFSSALWPFATLGWPEQTPELERYYPGDVNVTAREIIRLWENRMIFSGLFLLGEIPFTDVIINSTVLAVDGRRMSKSLGTGIDPLEAVAQARRRRDALRPAEDLLARRTSASAGARSRRAAKLANKLWNVARLILQKADGAAPALAPTTLEERWIAGRIDETRAEIEELLPQFDFSHVVDALYHLTFDDFCDWYAEAIKPRLYADDAAAIATALAALERLLALLHPVLPHVTEEIWSQFHDDAADPRPVARDRHGRRGRGAAMARVQSAAVTFRRSGALVALEGEEKRIFDAVVKPERPRSSRRRRRGRARAAAQGDRPLARRCSRTSASSRTRPREVVEAEREKLERYRRELEALGG